MAKERFDPDSLTTLSEGDVGPIEPLTTGTILTISQIYLQVSFHHERLGRKVDSATETLSADELEAFHYQSGRRGALREVLEKLGQAQLISTIDTRVNNIFDQSV